MKCHHQKSSKIEKKVHNNLKASEDINCMRNVTESLINHYTIGYTIGVSRAHHKWCWSDIDLTQPRERFLDNSVFQIEEESQINEKTRRKHRALEFSGLLNAEQIDRRKNG